MLGMSLIGAVFMYWHNVMRDEMFPKRFAEVEEGRIYRSGQISEGLLREVFVDNDIQLIVDLAGYEPRHRRQNQTPAVPCVPPSVATKGHTRCRH